VGNDGRRAGGRRWAGPAAIIALALVVRVAAVLTDGDYEPHHDAYDYDLHARSIAGGDGYPESGYGPPGSPSAIRSPAYPYVLGAVYRLAGSEVDAGRLAGAVLGATAVGLICLIATRIWGRRVGLVAAAMAALYPPLVLLSRELFAESLFIVALLAAAAAVLALGRSSQPLRWAVAAGLLCGLAALTTKAGVLVVIPIALGVWTSRPGPGAGRLAAPVTVVACAALVLAPWALRNAVEFGRLIPISTSTGFALAGTYNSVSFENDAYPGGWRSSVKVPEYRPLFHLPDVEEGTLDATLRREASEFALDHPAYVVEVAARNLLRLASLSGGSVVEGDVEVVDIGIGNRVTAAEKVGFGVAALLAVLGVAAIVLTRRPRKLDDGAVRRPIPRGPWFLWLIPVILIAAAAPVAGLPRYRLPADPFLLMLAAVGAVWAWDRLRALLAGRRGPIATGVALICAIAFAGCFGDDAPEPGTPPPAAALDPEYVHEADAICRDTLRETRSLVDNLQVSEAGDLLALSTEVLVAPGLEIRERQADRLQRLPMPASERATAAPYLDLFAPIEELIRQRIRAGRRGDQEAASELEDLLVDLGAEQRVAARRAGLDDCAVDFVAIAFSPAK
jgi:4-amino-4-deoxy-L-arabinose transferase-like glycosyltransferase